MCEVRVLLESYIVGQSIFSVRRVGSEEGSVGADNIVILLPIIITYSVLSPQLSPWHRKVGSPAARLASSRIVRKGQDDWTWEHSVGQRDTTLSPRYTGQELKQNQDLYQSWNTPRLQGLVFILMICYWLLSPPSPNHLSIIVKTSKDCLVSSFICRVKTWRSRTLQSLKWMYQLKWGNLLQNFRPEVSYTKTWSCRGGKLTNSKLWYLLLLKKLKLSPGQKWIRTCLGRTNWRS